jgi:hypothetical protein
VGQRCAAAAVRRKCCKSTYHLVRRGLGAQPEVDPPLKAIAFREGGQQDVGITYMELAITLQVARSTEGKE